MKLTKEAATYYRGFRLVIKHTRAAWRAAYRMARLMAGAQRRRELKELSCQH